MQRIFLYGFSLIELMIVITIMGIVSIGIYIPYAHYQNVVAVKESRKYISQSLATARNLALNGRTEDSSNMNIALQFASGSSQIDMYAFSGVLTTTKAPFWKKIDTIPLQPGVQMGEIASNGTTASETIFSFEALSDKSDNSLGATGSIDIGVNYGGSTSSTLSKKIRYYSDSHISDILD